MITNDMPLVQVAVLLVAGVGALNWGLVELSDTNLITDTLGLSASNTGLAYIVIGLAGAILVIDLLDIASSEGIDSSPLED